MELKMSQDIRRTCLWSVTQKVIWTLTPEKHQEVPVHAKYYNKEILSPTYLFGSTFQLYFYIHLLIWL